MLETFSHFFSALASLASLLWYSSQYFRLSRRRPGSVPGGGILKPSPKSLQARMQGHSTDTTACGALLHIRACGGAGGLLSARQGLGSSRACSVVSMPLQGAKPALFPECSSSRLDSWEGHACYDMGKSVLHGRRAAQYRAGKLQNLGRGDLEPFPPQEFMRLGLPKKKGFSHHPLFFSPYFSQRGWTTGRRA